MAIRLKNITKFVPGGYIYENPHPFYHKFPAESYSLKQQAKIVLDFRIANKAPRAAFEQVMEDIDIYTCLRLNGHERWCRETQKAYSEHHPRVSSAKRCGSCGK